MTTPERVRTLVEPVVADQGLDLYDLEFAGGVLRVVVSHPDGVGMDAIASLTRVLSRLLDDEDPIPGHFTLEVSSPGLERTLRTVAHFQGAVGAAVTVKTHAGVEGARRFRGTLEAADETGVRVALDEPAGEVRALAYDQIERARTVFDWGPAPKPGKAKPRPGAKSLSATSASTSTAISTAIEEKVPAS